MGTITKVQLPDKIYKAMDALDAADCDTARDEAYAALESAITNALEEARGDKSIDALTAQVAGLESERDGLKRAVDEAIGVIDILRTKHDAAICERDRLREAARAEQQGFRERAVIAETALAKARNERDTARELLRMATYGQTCDRLDRDDAISERDRLRDAAMALVNALPKCRYVHSPYPGAPLAEWVCCTKTATRNSGLIQQRTDGPTYCDDHSPEPDVKMATPLSILLAALAAAETVE